MREVTDSLKAFEEEGGNIHPMDKAAQSWASYALGNMTGKHLKAALAISTALAAFVSLEMVTRGTPREPKL
jgi:hypothetical protein